jgi:tight adherence protein C
MVNTTSILVTVFITFFCLALGLNFLWNRDRTVQRRLAGLQAAQNPLGAAPQSPSAWQGMASRMGPLLTRLATPREGGKVSDLRIHFYNAGLRHASWLPAFIVAKVFLALLLPALMQMFGGLMGAQVLSLPVIAALVVLCAVGYYIPNMVLNIKVEHRQREIQEAMPDAIDLLTICVEAGLGIDAAMRKTGSELSLRSAALAEELDLVVLELQVGASRDTAMHNFSMRTGVEDVAVFVTILLQSEHFGSNMADSLRIHSETMRDKRTQRAEEIAAKIPIKLLFPTLFFIFPSIFIVLLGPAAIGIFRTLLPSMGGSH